MDVQSIDELERRLLATPFDSTVRLAYGCALQGVERHEEALQQFDLLLDLPDPPAAAGVGAARSLLALARTEDAVERYSRARSLRGFEPDSMLDAAVAEHRRVTPIRLAVVAGATATQKPGDGSPAATHAARRSQITFADVAGMEDLKRTVRMQIIEPFLRPGLFAKFRKRAGGGVLLYGPPGCGKTMLARAVAGECRAEFISVGLSDVLSMWIGQSEQNLVRLFDKARSSRPSVLFLDELDGLAFARSKANSEHTRQTVNELLSQLDGFGSDNQGVLILAATNMPWDVDPAMKRPGRFARQVFVAPPDETARAEIIRLNLRDTPHEGIDADAIARVTPHFSGADLQGLVESAKDYALEDHILRGLDRGLQQADLEKAAASARASTLDWLRTAQNLVKYAGVDDAYRDVENYLKKSRIL